LRSYKLSGCKKDLRQAAIKISRCKPGMPGPSLWSEGLTKESELLNAILNDLKNDSKAVEANGRGNSGCGRRESKIPNHKTGGALKPG